MEKKEIYLSPEIMLVKFASSDVITQSSDFDGEDDESIILPKTNI